MNKPGNWLLRKILPEQVLNGPCCDCFLNCGVNVKSETKTLLKEPNLPKLNLNFQVTPISPLFYTQNNDYCIRFDALVQIKLPYSI